MINTRKIKSRFRHDHLVKLANKLLLKDLTMKSYDGKWFTLRNGYTIEDLANSVSFHGLEEKVCKTDQQGRHWHLQNAVFNVRQVNFRGLLIDVPIKFEIVCDDDWRTGQRGRFLLAGYIEKLRTAPFQYQLDHIIMWDLMRYCSHIIKDNSEIPIYI